jgi:hypothetical protein
MACVQLLNTLISFMVKLYPAVCLMHSLSPTFGLLISICFSGQISQSYKTDGVSKLLAYMI